MKKLLALLLALVMVLGMVACGAKTDAPAGEPADAPAADAPAADAAGDIPAAEDVEQAEKTNEDAITVTYFCTIGAYLDLLASEIDKWNAGEGAEKGVYIDLTSNINDGSSAVEMQMQAGNHWDLMDGAANQSWYLQGWVQPLNEIENEELQALIASYEEYIVPPKSIVDGKLLALPLEVVPLKMAVNLDLLESAGLTVDDIKTWEGVINAAQKITEANPGTAWGYGGTTWTTGYIRRLHMKGMSSSIETGYWDPNTGNYSFDQYKPVMDGLKTMYENGWMLGMDDLAIDPIRAEFAAGKVGMFPAPAYDWSVYTNQFPATCNFTFVDMPTLGEEAEYKGVYMDRVNCGIDKVNWDAADDAKKQAILDAFLFLNSDELYSTLYANAAIIPYKTEIIESTEIVIEKNAEQWAAMSDLTNYCSEYQQADAILPLEGDTFVTLFVAYMHGEGEWDEIVADLNQRYNDAWAIALDDPDITTDTYLYDYDHTLD